MADLTEAQAAGTTKIVGSDATGVETNFAAVTVALALVVDGSAVTQPVSGTVAINAAIPAGANVIGAANVNVANSSTVTVMQNAVAVTGNGTSLSVTGYGTSVLQITGTFVASIAFEASVDAGASWLAISATQVGQGDIFNVATVPGLYRLTVSGMDLIRARVTWTSGTSITINGRSTNAVNASKIVKLATGGLSIGTVQQAALTKGTQGATGVSTQDLKDASRNITNYYMTIPILTTATDTLMSLTGYKGGAAVAATTTPAVVTTGKTYRITSVSLTYVSTATAGTVKFTLRANAAGTVLLASNAVNVWVVGNSIQAGASQTVDFAIPEGMEFAAGFGIGISMVGLTATQTLGATGYTQLSIFGYEY